MFDFDDPHNKYLKITRNKDTPLLNLPTVLKNTSLKISITHCLILTLAGGRREGAGRKPLSNSLELTTRLSVCVTESQAKTFKAKGGAKWLRSQIDKPVLTLPAESSFPSSEPTHQSAPLFSSYVHAGFPNVAESHIDKSMDLNEVLIKNASATFLSESLAIQ